MVVWPFTSNLSKYWQQSKHALICLQLSKAKASVRRVLPTRETAILARVGMALSYVPWWLVYHKVSTMVIFSHYHRYSGMSLYTHPWTQILVGICYCTVLYKCVHMWQKKHTYMHMHTSTNSFSPTWYTIIFHSPLLSFLSPTFSKSFRPVNARIFFHHSHGKWSKHTYPSRNPPCYLRLFLMKFM